MNSQKRYGWSVLGFVLLCTATASAADIPGTWAIQDLQIAGKLQFSINAVQNGRGTLNSSSAIDISELRSLTTGQLANPAGTMARFEIVREAGTFVCEGYVKAGTGAGSFVFRPNPGFLGQMRALGLSDVSEDRLFSMALHGIGPQFAAEIRGTGTAVSSASQLVSMRIHGVTAEFIRRIQQAGYQPDGDDLVRMRIHGVTPEFATEVRQTYAAASVDDLVRMRIHGVGLDFAGEVGRIYPAASIDDLVRLRIHGVTTDYMNRMRSRLQTITLEQLVRLKIHGIED